MICVLSFLNSNAGINPQTTAAIRCDLSRAASKPSAGVEVVQLEGRAVRRSQPRNPPTFLADQDRRIRLDT